MGLRATKSGSSSDDVDTNVSTAVQRKLMQSKVGWTIIGVAGVAAALFAIWSSLPDETKMSLIERTSRAEITTTPGATEISRELILNFDGYNEVKTESVQATAGFKIIPESVSARGTQGESAESPSIGSRSADGFVVQIRLKSSFKGLKKRNGWATVVVTWKERPAH